jgi:transcriptional regulator with XRE-family HTH domain
MRKNKGITRRAAAIALGTTENTLYSLETDPNYNPTAALIRSLSDYYGVTADAILGREEVAK